ncbi:MAG: nitroreductase [Lachnospiraceae bacterium]|nr:nitroreductase [Lachnospiraceae bacterium]
MNEVMNAILNRRSVRKFSAEPVPQNILEDLAEAGLHAPSGMGKKTWKFTVISNPEIIAELAAVIGQELGRADYNMYAPAALIIPSNLRDSGFGREDDACALQNIFLAAYSYGVGSVWINQLNGICDHAPVRAMLTKLGIPEDHVVYGMAALGYADPDAPKGEFRRAGEVSFVK